MPAESPLALQPLPFVVRALVRRRHLVVPLMLVVIGGAACAVAVQYGMKMLVDAMAEPERSLAAVQTPLLLFIGLIALENTCWRLGGWLGCRTVVGVRRDVRLDLFRHLCGHSTSFFADHFAGSLGNRVIGTANSMGALIGTFTWNIVPPCTEVLGAVLVLATVHGSMAAALTTFVAVAAGGIALFAARGRPLHRQFAEREATSAGELVDMVSNVWSVKAFSARTREERRLARVLGEEADAQRRSWMHLERTRILHDLLLWLMAGGMLVWAVSLWADGTITPGDVVVVSALTFRILHGSRDLAFALVGTTQQFGQIAEALRVLGRPHAVVDGADARPLIGLGGAVEFEDVSFAYGEGRPVFEGLTLRIPAGQRIGIVGPSGAGKSTLVGLLQRMQDVDRGRILIDGQCIRGVTQDTLRAGIAVVPQEIALFHRSLMENIRYGRPDATEEDVVAASRAAQCDDFIRSLPQGYDTLVGERGVRLSGGQRQRIGIARAFLKDAPIIVLDEATSALDTESEREVQTALTALMQGRTVLAVAHRLSTLAAFDRIVVIADGRIVEDGSPAELRRRGGTFDALWRLQAESLVTDDAPGR